MIRPRTTALLTVAALVGGLVLGIGAGDVVDTLLFPRLHMAGRVIAGIVALSIIARAGFLWGRRLATSFGHADPVRAGRVAAPFLGLPVIAVGAGFAALEPFAVARGGELGMPNHAVYTILFVPATLLVAAIGSFGLGLALRDRMLGARLALGAAPAAAGAFLLVAAFMYAIGWRVGEPHAAERATMLVVTFLGFTAAALAAGAVIGRVLVSDFVGLVRSRA